MVRCEGSHLVFLILTALDANCVLAYVVCVVLCVNFSSVLRELSLKPDQQVHNRDDPSCGALLATAQQAAAKPAIVAAIIHLIIRPFSTSR